MDKILNKVILSQVALFFALCAIVGSLFLPPGSAVYMVASGASLTIAGVSQLAGAVANLANRSKDRQP